MTSQVRFVFECGGIHDHNVMLVNMPFGSYQRFSLKPCQCARVFFVLLCLMAYRRKSVLPATTTAEKSESVISEPKYQNHWVTGAAKMFKTREGKWTNDAGETKTSLDHTKNFYSDSADSLHRPAIGFSVRPSMLRR